MKLFFTLLLLLPLITFSQTASFGVDKLTGDTTYYTSHKRIHFQWGVGSAGEILSVWLSKNKTSKLLNLSITTGDFLPHVKSGDKLYVKFTNGTILELTSVNDFTGEPMKFEKGSFLDCSYPLADADISLLKENNVILIRHQHDGRYRDYEISGNNSSFLSRSGKVLFN